MPPYLFPLPTTTLLTFSSLLTDPSGSYTSVLSEATAARTRLQLALKSVHDNEPGSSALAVLDAVQVYLPYLKGIIACLDADELLFKGEPNFPWTSPLTQYKLSPPLLSLPSIHSENLFVLLTYTLALSNYAHYILSSLPTYEKESVSRNLSSEDEKRITAGLSRAVDLLCQASGLADWIAENVSLQVEPIKNALGGRLAGKGGNRWPVESNRETFKGLSMMFLADAHLTAIRKLLLPVLPHVLFSPAGPPLPSNHPSASLLAKLYLHVTSLYTSSRALLKVQQHSSSSEGKKLFSKEFDIESSEGEIIVTLKRYLKKESFLSSALANKWLGIDLGEGSSGKSSTPKIGEAISYLKESLSRLEDLEDSKTRERLKGLSIGIGRNTERKKEERKSRKSRVEYEVEDTKAWVRSYTKMNDTVTFQPIPPVSSLIAPSGRPIFGPKAFVPPPSKFEPARRLPSPGDDDDEIEGKEKGGEGEAEYAGKGSYF
ncbi:pH-response regulator protein palC [Kwoniella mangroviensis CBS 10435]|uniref:pH-response regulator protein palC n=1 Tax=Kwoniella mangroviensis CBS 10435 TaxID=1331196 RepID=A0A1B9INV0_9TREE|nr:pH-response regulator protein palC [Kwoniella mangroviensis CBS 10435]